MRGEGIGPDSDERKLSFGQKAARVGLAGLAAGSVFFGAKAAVESASSTEGRVSNAEQVNKDAELIRAEDGNYIVQSGDSPEGIYDEMGYKEAGYSYPAFEKEVGYRNAFPKVEGKYKIELKPTQGIILPKIESKE